MPLSPDDRKRLASLSELLDTHRREPFLQASELAESLHNHPLTMTFHRAPVKTVTAMLKSTEAQKNLDAAALVADLDGTLSGALERAAAPVIVQKLSGTGAVFKVGLKMLRSARPQRLLQSWWRTCTPYGHSITLTPSAFHLFLPKYHEAVFDAMLCGLRQLSSVMSQSPDPLDADALRQCLGSSNVIVIQEREEPWSGEER